MPDALHTGERPAYRLVHFPRQMSQRVFHQQVCVLKLIQHKSPRSAATRSILTYAVACIWRLFAIAGPLWRNASTLQRFSLGSSHGRGRLYRPPPTLIKNRLAHIDARVCVFFSLHRPASETISDKRSRDRGTATPLPGRMLPFERVTRAGSQRAPLFR